MSDHGSTRGALLLLAGAALFGTVGTARVLGPDMPSPVVAAGRLVFAAVILVVAAVAISPGGKAAPGRLLRSPWVLLAGVGQAGFQVSFLAAVELAGVATGTLIAIGCTPVLAGLITRQVGRTWVMATTVALVGLVLLVGGAPERPAPFGVIAALGASLSYATYITASHRVAATGAGTLPAIAGIFAVAAVLLAPALLLFDLGSLWTLSGLATVTYLALIPTVLAYAAFNFGLRSVAPSTAATLGLIEPVVAATLGIAVLGERLGLLGLLGATLVLTGLVILVQVQRRAARTVVPSAP